MRLVHTDQEPLKTCALLAALNAFVLNYVLRQKASGGNLNFYILKQFPIHPPVTYDAPSPRSPNDLLAKWIASRVLELTYTASDLHVSWPLRCASVATNPSETRSIMCCRFPSGSPTVPFLTGSLTSEIPVHRNQFGLGNTGLGACVFSCTSRWNGVIVPWVIR